MARSDNKLFEGLDFSGALDELTKIDAEHAAKQPTRPSSLPLASIVEDPHQPRREFTDESLKEMADSIRERGVLQPITVLPANADGKHVIVMGARRFRASLSIGRETIPAFIRVEPADSYDQMIENIQREALSHRDIATFIRDQLATGAKKSVIAKKLGKPPAWITAYVDFFDMDPAIQEGVNEFGPRAAYELHTAMQIDAEKTRDFLASGQPVTQRSALLFRQSLRMGQDEAAPPATPPVPTGSHVSNEPTHVPSQERRSVETKAAALAPAASPVTPEPVDPRPGQRSSSPATESVSAREPKRDDTGPASNPEPAMPLVQDDASVPPAMLVRLNERVGRLLMEREAGQGGSFGVVAFDDGAEEEARLSDLILLEIVRADRRSSGVA